MAESRLTKADYQKLFTLTAKLPELDEHDYYREFLRLLEEIFGWRRTLAFVLNMGDGLSFPQVEYMTSRTMSQAYLNSCAAAYSSERVMYESMKRRRASNQWMGVSYTQDTPKGDYDNSAFVGKLRAMGFSHAVVLYLNLSPVICIALCLTEEESTLSGQDRERIQAIRDTLAAYTQMVLQHQRMQGLWHCIQTMAEGAEPYYAILNNKLGPLMKSEAIEPFAEKHLGTANLSAIAAPLLKGGTRVSERVLRPEGITKECDTCRILLRPLSYRYAESTQQVWLMTLRLITPGIVGLDPAAAKKYDLTKREVEVAGMVVQGLTNREIAEAMHISANTAKVHLANMFRKLGASNRMEAIQKLKE